MCGSSHVEGTTQSAVEWRHHHSRPGEPAGRPGGDVQSALAGGAAPYLADVIGHKLNLDEGSKAIAHAIAGAVVAELQGRNALAGAAGAQAGKNAVENNFLSQERPKDFTEQLKGCNGNPSCEQGVRKDMAKESAENILKLKSCWDAGDTACVAQMRTQIELNENAYTALRVYKIASSNLGTFN
ncbi:VENN motif pre-toxin domain-containing protein [Franconibacter sp. IITDAS19]|uniref:VENN motif pre-toxin domain-containing protein n=1 Tax=Franconibacter sp. IITDAS19 TaxID=2930569 RepID=UPI001FF83B97|nr:VENN motif pre-toxin domain-containing protein [Franconibacter sp. IITDAS19]MCK1970570.1 VENN motif pre-toxin domain-containing protein [Franconibacter sp. IITDAS19]